MLAILEILLFLGILVLLSVPRKAKERANIKPRRQIRPELSNYMVTEDGKLEEINKPQDTSLFQ